jgi:hypothetical protein
MKKSSLKPSCGDRRAHFSVAGAFADFHRLQHADEFLGAGCSSTPACCSRNTKDEAEPSMMGFLPR